MPVQMSLTDGISPHFGTFYICLALLVIFCSLVCNIFVITTVYGWNDVHKPVDCFIMNLSLWDIISLLFGTLTVDNVHMNWAISDVFCKASYTVVYAGYAVTVLTLCAVCLERYYGICKSVMYQKHLNSTRWKLIFPGIWFLSIALFAVYFHAYERKMVKTPNEITGHVCDENWIPETSTIFYLLVPVLLLTIAPLVLIIFIFVKIIKKLKVSRTPSSGGSAVLNMKRKQTVKMLIYIVLVHYLCWLPTIILKVVNAFGNKSPWYWFILAFCDLPHYARSIFYTLIYYRMYPVFMSNFGLVCKSCFCCSATRKDNSK